MEAEDRVARVLGEWIAAHEDGEALDVEVLLRRHPDLEDELRRGLSALARVDVALGTAETPRLRLPERVGGYRVLSSLGDGGMGTVYKAEAEVENAVVPVGTTVALKCVHPHLLRKPGFYDRLRREAELGQRIRHPNVVRTYGTGSDDTEDLPDHLLVMEYVEGQTLRQLTEELGQVPEELCRHIATEVAQGLQAIHEAGAVHRDLKPENVMITEDHRVKIMDLGVAWLADAQIRLSQTGIFLGSLLYASPEQIQGNAVDGRSDLYALGLVLYELACGSHPFRADASAEVIHRQLEIAPRPLGEVNPQISPFLERVVDTLTRKPADERLGSAGDLAQVLTDGEQGKWWKKQASILCRSTKRPLRRIRIPRETEIYGREADLDHLRTLYRKAKAGEGRVVLIDGEAGIGKTRLVDEFVGRLREGGEDFNFLFGSYPPGGAATASGAFSTAFREHFGEEGLEDALREYSKPTPDLVPAFAALLRGDSAPTGAVSLAKDSHQTVFVHVTRSLAAERTTIVLIDDLHFAPEDGRALFASLGMAVPDQRILLIGTMRPGVPSEWITSLDRLTQTTHRMLTRIGPKDLVSLLEDSFRSRHLAEELGVQIARKADGNPFFALEIIRGLREGQLITRRPDGSWGTTQMIQDIQVPDSVRDLVNARVADLHELERDILDVASCCGFEFDPLLVAKVVGLGQIPALKRMALIERRYRLIRSTGAKYVFDHHQVQEALNAGLHEKLRQSYHAAIADALEARTGALDKDPTELGGSICVKLCEHHLKGAQGRKALRYLEAALDHLGAGFLNDLAIALADRALGIEGLLVGKARFDVLLKKNGRLELLAHRSEQEVVLAEARALAEERGEKASLARVERATGILLYRTGSLHEAQKHFERCLAIFREIGDRASEARVTGNLGGVFSALGRHEEAREHHEWHLAIAREIGDRQGEAEATGNLGVACRALGRHEEARAQYEQSLTIAREIGDRHVEAMATGNLGVLFYVLGRYEEAKTHFERRLAVTREMGDRAGEATVTGNLGIVADDLGNCEEAKTHVERHLTIAREIGDRAGEVSALAAKGILLQGLGRSNEAQEQHVQSLRIAREIGYRSGEAVATANLGVACRALGRYGDAKVHYDRYLAITREIGDRSGEATALVNLGLTLLGLGDAGRAREALEASLALCRVIGARSLEGYALFGLAEVAHESDQQTQAFGLAYEALALRRKIGHQSGVADSLRQFGDLRGRAGDIEGAREAIEEALALAREQQERTQITLAMLANLPDGDTQAAETALHESGEAGNTPETRYYVWKATGKREHLAEAKRLLDDRVEHAPEEYRDSMLKNVRLNREIMQAWAEHGGGEQEAALEPA